MGQTDMGWAAPRRQRAPLERGRFDLQSDPPTKECRVCRRMKPFSDFYPHPTGRFGIGPKCKACHCWLSSQNHRRSIDRVRSSRAKAKYGLEAGAYEAMLAAQGGACAICGRRSTKRLHIDHDHATGRVRGLLCGPCNMGIGHLGDEPERLRRAAGYLEGTR